MSFGDERWVGKLGKEGCLKMTTNSSSNDKMQDNGAMVETSLNRGGKT